MFLYEVGGVECPDCSEEIVVGKFDYVGGLEKFAH